MMASHYYDYYNTMTGLPFTYRGLIAPVYSYFKNDGTLDLHMMSKVAAIFARRGLQGVLVNSPFGNEMSMTVAERKLVTEAWVTKVKETLQHLMVEVGGAPLCDVIELAKHADNLQVNSILCLPDSRNKPTTQEQLIDYLKKVGEAVPNTPLLYHHKPLMTKVDINMGQFLESIGDKIPSFVGINFASTNLQEGAEALRAVNGKYVIFFDNDQLITAAYLLGMESFISINANWNLRRVKDLLAACKKRDWSSAQCIQQELSDDIIVKKHVVSVESANCTKKVRERKKREARELGKKTETEWMTTLEEIEQKAE